MLRALSNLQRPLRLLGVGNHPKIRPSTGLGAGAVWVRSLSARRRLRTALFFPGLSPLLTYCDDVR